MTAIRAVLFDKDGTLIDFQATWGPAAVRVVGQLSEGDPERRDCLARIIGLDLAAERINPASIFIGGATEDYAPGWAACLCAADVPALDYR